jgi:hypothetical protein
MVERGSAGMSYDAQRISAFYDEYGEREWTRFEDGRNTRASLAVHIHYLRRFGSYARETSSSTSAPGLGASQQSWPVSAWTSLSRTSRRGNSS